MCVFCCVWNRTQEVGFICIYLFMNTCLRVGLVFFLWDVRVEVTVAFKQIKLASDTAFNHAHLSTQCFNFFVTFCFFFCWGESLFCYFLLENGKSCARKKNQIHFNTTARSLSLTTKYKCSFINLQPPIWMKLNFIHQLMNRCINIIKIKCI